MDGFKEELNGLFRAVGDRVSEQCYFRVLESVRDLGSADLVDGSVPLEAWIGMVQAIADASGFRVVTPGSRNGADFER